LTDAGGDTVANVPQTAAVTLPNGTVSWEADMLTKVGHGAGVDQQGNPGNTGISVQSSDGLEAVSFSIFPDHSLQVGSTVNGVFQGWRRVGTAPTGNHRGAEEELWHNYAIQRDFDGTFSLYFDGRQLSRGIQAGPPDAWANGLGSGLLFTESPLDDRHTSTVFDGVRAWGYGNGPHAPGGSGGDSSARLPANDFAATASFDLSRAASVPAQAMARTNDAPAALAATTDNRVVRLSGPPAGRADRDDLSSGTSSIAGTSSDQGAGDTAASENRDSTRTQDSDLVGAADIAGR
jgi:hypothetical protein